MPPLELEVVPDKRPRRSCSQTERKAKKVNTGDFQNFGNIGSEFRIFEILGTNFRISENFETNFRNYEKLGANFRISENLGTKSSSEFFRNSETDT